MDFVEAIPHAREILGDDTTQLFLNQLLLATVIKQGGSMVLDVADVDATGGHMMSVDIDQEAQTFTLIARQKQ